MTANNIYSFFLQFQILFKVTLLIFYFTVEISSQNARLGQSLAEFEEFPYVANILSYNNRHTGQPQLVCTGALLSLQHILIPGSCVPDNIVYVEIQAGSVFGLHSFEYTLQWHSATLYSDIIKHSHFPSGNIVILELLNTRLEETPAVTSILIANDFQPSPTDPGYYIVGYPVTYPLRDDVHNDPKAILTKTSINVNNRTYCGEHLQIDPELELCTGVITGGIGSCDTFGALLIKKGATLLENDELLGILRNDCCGAPRCFDTFYDLTNPSIRVQEILDASSRTAEPTTVETTTEAP